MKALSCVATLSLWTAKIIAERGRNRLSGLINWDLSPHDFHRAPHMPDGILHQKLYTSPVPVQEIIVDVP